MERDPLFSQAMGHLQEGWHCAEAVALTVLENFSSEPSLSAVKAASAFGGGIAGSTEELCGAFSGGVIALSCLLGRNEPHRELRDCARVVKEFKERFRQEYGTLQCRPLLDAQAEQDREAPSCAHITAQAAVLLGGLLRERLGLIPGVAVAGEQITPGPTLAPGACPFGGCGC